MSPRLIQEFFAKHWQPEKLIAVLHDASGKPLPNPIPGFAKFSYGWQSEVDLTDIRQMQTANDDPAELMHFSAETLTPIAANITRTLDERYITPDRVDVVNRDQILLQHSTYDAQSAIYWKLQSHFAGPTDRWALLLLSKCFQEQYRDLFDYQQLHLDDLSFGELMQGQYGLAGNVFGNRYRRKCDSTAA